MPDYAIGYGKAGVPVYRRGRDDSLFACEVDVEVLGSNFLPAYTEGDNSAVVATDSMKNVVIRQALVYQGVTVEGFLHHLGGVFLDRYPHMHELRLTGRELRFEHDQGPLYSRSRDDHGTAMLQVTRGDDGRVTIVDHRCARADLRLLKVTGSAFTRFVRDENTTLPEREDRPLYIYLDVGWRYDDPADAVGADPTRHVASERVAAVVREVFAGFVSESIQHLVHEMGTRLLERFDQLGEVSFEAQNRTREPFVRADDGSKLAVYSDPFPAWGTIELTVRR